MYKNKTILLSALISNLCLSVSCSSESGITPVVQEHLSTPTVSWPLSDIQTRQVDGINDFAMDLLRMVDEKAGGKDFVISPLSVAYALGMASGSSVGQTRNEITSALGFTPGDAQALDNLCASLISHCETDGGVLKIANAMYVRQDIDLMEDLRNRLADTYNARIEEADFSKHEVIDNINRWASEQTGGMIRQLLCRIDESTMLCLLNAVSMRAKWERPFATTNTRNRQFHKTDGTAIWIPTMQQTDVVDYTNTAEAQLLRIPYRGNRYAMTIYLPTSNRSPLVSLEGTTGRGLMELRQALEPKLVNAFIPRFTTESEQDLRSAVMDMGIRSAFDPTKAEFNNVATGEGLFLNAILQKAVINVNEEGTEAAAATILAGETATGDSLEPVYFSADHPFLYIITDEEAGIILFAGIYYGKE